MNATHCETCGMDWKHHGTACTVGSSQSKRSLVQAPGRTYGLKSHLWAAFALAAFASETAKETV
jgi:hypothetical protein